MYGYRSQEARRSFPQEKGTAMVGSTLGVSIFRKEAEIVRLGPQESGYPNNELFLKYGSRLMHLQIAAGVNVWKSPSVFKSRSLTFTFPCQLALAS